MRNVVKIQTYNYYAALLFPGMWLLLLTVQAIREHSIEIYFQMWLYGIFGAVLIWTNTLIRYVSVDYESRTITLRDGIPNKTIIPSGSLKEIDYANGRYNLSISIDNKVVKESWPFLFYFPKEKKRIINTLLEFNPQVKRTGF